ncbi:MAG: hypothetical protein H8E74_10800 [Gammaproteobacteria bacterium]|nr:hypothetical protein [Gammaproteobacteria bacterium]
MKLLYEIILIVFTGLVIGCTNSTYQPLKSSIGYWDNVIEGYSNSFNIGYKGAEWVNESKEEEERVIDFTLLRSAEVAKSHGYSFFIISENKSYKEEKFIMNDKCLKELETKIPTCNRFKYIGSFSTVNFKDADNIKIANNVIQEGQYKDYNLYNANLIITSITNEYNLNVSPYSGDPKSSSGYNVYRAHRLESAIDIVDAKPHNPRD